MMLELWEWRRGIAMLNEVAVETIYGAFFEGFEEVIYG
jgi:hypothetical protein